ncbi:hypothetical protein [Pedobacter rhizosphaerae]|uniref:Lipocalin-like domain-containing protein n=1 Tax=Pedobacter rhizosphaerae TaxID=390241 RepID=A0A1H9T9K6_9SPHI|nr:hypothetical protein [Pedobacter rhizosphaerae]SER93614.1 hypothetical protein SAMN04488023_12136 [Pedobacter rhizosphaerae]
MKKTLLLLMVCLGLACKKKTVNAEDDITKYSWPLQSATVSPALLINGQLETDFKTKSASQACLNHNYSIEFFKSGNFAFGSNGPLCDMISYKNATWVKNGSQITLNYGTGSSHTIQISGSVITDKYVFEQNNTTYTVTYIFTAKPK